MSPYLFSADHARTVLVREDRAATLVSAIQVLSITDLFAEYAAAVSRGDRARVAEIRLAADPELLAELDGFNEPAAA
ncbi:predicted protein [Streptomyces viridosporus ATCC 14672]|uniref:Predicted protein n=1 Tax=Streptomyces viridosporus (strain ATCC 14672 / DSM 40746 / JCM 4963 / KCTC 9882 / NRRL B-12104 / FH 1290) TaxID=566461 RepID=D6A4G3_STRV1|nr:hypothetical protein [Streptomyces viridosporus]EFE65803.1 predicted protein [Streptomyces viridosporus ATCC 14672]